MSASASAHVLSRARYVNGCVDNAFFAALLGALK